MGLQFVAEHAPDLTLPEDRIFRAQLKEMKLHTFRWTDRKVSPPEEKESSTLQWWWEVQSTDEYNGRKVKGECNPTLSDNPNNRFRKWAEALLQREIPAGMGLDSDDLVGLTADITIRHRPDKKDPDKKWEEVDEVIPVTSLGDEPPF